MKLMNDMNKGEWIETIATVFFRVGKYPGFKCHLELKI